MKLDAWQGQQLIVSGGKKALLPVWYLWINHTICIHSPAPNCVCVMKSSVVGDKLVKTIAIVLVRMISAEVRYDAEETGELTIASGTRERSDRRAFQISK